MRVSQNPHDSTNRIIAFDDADIAHGRHGATVIAAAFAENMVLGFTVTLDCVSAEPLSTAFIGDLFAGLHGFSRERMRMALVKIKSAHEEDDGRIRHLLTEDSEARETVWMEHVHVPVIIDMPRRQERMLLDLENSERCSRGGLFDRMLSLYQIARQCEREGFTLVALKPSTVEGITDPVRIIGF